MEKNIGEYCMLKFICYNWMPTIADHVLDLPESFYKSAGTSRMHNIDQFNPYMIKDNDLIFVKTDFIVNGYFRKNFLDKIFKTFNLITGVSDYQISDYKDEYFKILNHPGLKKWISVNPPSVYNDKIIPIPIGFTENSRPFGCQSFLKKMQENKKQFDKKQDKILLPYHTQDTNSSRSLLIDKIKNLSFVVFQKEKQDISDYFQTINEYKYVICLEGNGPDVHRYYETMLMGSIPISIKNVMKNVFDYHLAEGVFLDSWEDLNENGFQKLVNVSYNIDNNDKFLNLNYHIERIKKEIQW
tara:strand:+ start:1783 stop:2679 length:897 start_codon:yes stop_codon:yes gene_type:complete